MSPPLLPARPRVPLRTWLPPVVIAPLAATWWWRTGHWGAAAAAAVSLTILATALFAPRIHAPLQRVLDRFAHLILQLATWTVLGLVFAFVFVPGRLVLALLRRDPLARRLDRNATTYLETPPASASGPTAATSRAVTAGDATVNPYTRQF